MILSHNSYLKRQKEKYNILKQPDYTNIRFLLSPKKRTFAKLSNDY